MSKPRCRVQSKEERKELKCTVCSREAHANGYCRSHLKAYQNITKYEHWTKALESSWKEYLREIAKNPVTGRWAREVAEKLAEMEKN